MAEIIKKVSQGGGAGFDYSTLQAAEDSLPADFVVAGNNYVLELYKDGGIFNNSRVNALTISGITTSATFNLVVRAAAGHGWNTNPNVRTNRFAYVPANGVAIAGAAGYGNVIHSQNASNVIFDGLQVSGIGGSQNGIELGPNGIIRYCIVYSNGQYGRLGHPTIRFSGSNCLIHNSLIANYGGSSTLYGYGSGQARSCTFVYRSDQANDSRYAPYTNLTNCASFFFLFGQGENFTRNYVGTDWSGYTGGTNTNMKYNLVYADQFVNPSMASGLEDYRLKTTSQLINAGMNDAATIGSADASGYTRNFAWDIGAWQNDTYTGPIGGNLNQTMPALSTTATGISQQAPQSANLSATMPAMTGVAYGTTGAYVYSSSVAGRAGIGLSQQPQFNAQINRANPDTRNLVAFWSFGGGNVYPYGDKRGNPVINGGSIAFGAGPDGIQATGNNLRLDTGLTAQDLRINGSNARTVIMDFDWDTGVGGGVSIFSAGTSSSQQDFTIVLEGSNFYIKLNTWATDYLFNVPTAGTGMHRVWLACGYTGANGNMFYYSVVKHLASGNIVRGAGNASNTTNTLNTANTNTALFGGGPGNGWGRYNQPIRKCIVFGGGYITRDQFERIVAKPWSLLTSGRRVVGSVTATPYVPTSHTLTTAEDVQSNTSGTGVVGVIASINLTGATSSQDNTSSTGSNTSVHNIAASATSQANTSGTGAASQNVVIVGSATQQTQTSTSGAITRSLSLTGATSSVANTSDTGVVARTVTLTGSATTQDSTASTGVETQVHNIVASATSQSNTSTLGAVALTRTLLGTTSTQDNSASTGVIGSIASLAAATTTQDNTANTAAVVVLHNVTGAVSTVVNTSSTSTVAVTRTLTGAVSSQDNTTSTGVETQVHNIVATATSQANSASTATVALTRILSGVGSSQASTSNAGAVIQTQYLVGTTSSVDSTTNTGVIARTVAATAALTTVTNQSSTGGVTLVRTLSGAASSQANTTDTGIVGGAGSLVASNTSQLNISATAAIVQVQVLAGASSSQSNASSTGIETQVHNLAASATSQGNVTNLATVALTRVLTGSTTSQANASNTGAVTSGGALVGAVTNQANMAVAGAINVVHLLSGSSSGQNAASGTASVNLIRTLSGAASNTLQTNGTITAAITQRIVLEYAVEEGGSGAGGPMVIGQSNTSSTGSVSRVIDVLGTDASQDNASSIGGITFTYNLIGSDSSQRNRSAMAGINGYGEEAPVTEEDIQKIASAVWNQQAHVHKEPGTFGKLVNSLLTVAKFLGLK